jgi:50S ribosomal protein L16 3-hydroxylase
VLEPGDMLYLPPGVAHEGTAVGAECITCSIGFRAPSYRDLADPWLDALAEHAHDLPALRTQLGDPANRPTLHPARLPKAMIDTAHRRLKALKPARGHAVTALLALLSEPKPVVSFGAPARPLSIAQFRRSVMAKGLQLDLRTRLMYAAGRAGINGECLALEVAERAPIARLADRRELLPADCCRLSEAVVERLHGWYVDGWLHPGRRR